MANEITINDLNNTLNVTDSDNNSITVTSPTNQITIDTISGPTSFTALTDTPSAFTSQSLKLVRVNSGETALEFVDPETIEDINWGEITGTLSNQTDLQAALDLKYDAADFNSDWDTRLATKTTTDLAEGTNLYYTSARFDTAFSAKSTTDLSEGTNLYYTEVRVSANTDVAANTAARHDALTVTDSSEIDFTLTGQDLTASLITGSIDILKLDSGVQTSLGLADTALQNTDVYGPLTSGYIPYYDGVDFANSPFYTDGTDVGLGTTSPSAKLDVLSTTDPQLRVSYSASVYGTIGISSAGDMNINVTGDEIDYHYAKSGNAYLDIGQLGTSGTKYLRIFDNTAQPIVLASNANSYIDNNANFGIGTKTPLYLLDVDGTTNVDTLRLDEAASKVIIDYAEEPDVSSSTLSTSTTGGTITANTYYLSVTYLDADGHETEPSDNIDTSITTTGSTSTITINNLPVSSNPNVTQRNVYMGTSSIFQNYQVTVANNTDTSVTLTSNNTTIGNDIFRNKYSTTTGFGNTLGGIFENEDGVELFSIGKEGQFYMTGERASLIFPQKDNGQFDSLPFYILADTDVPILKDDFSYASMFFDINDGNALKLGAFGRGGYSAKRVEIHSDQPGVEFSLNLQRGAGTTGWVSISDGGTSSPNQTFVYYDPTQWTATSGINRILGLANTINMGGSAGYEAFQINITENTTGSGVKNLANWNVNASSKFSVDSSGNLLVSGSSKSSSATAGIGYATGAGGTVTQSTSKSTGVTINKVCGTITMNGAALAANTAVTFTVTNSAVASGDLIAITHSSVGTFGSYNVVAHSAGAGTFNVTVRNVTSGSLSQAIVLKFAVIKAVTS